MRKSGYKFEYHIELHRCLKHLINKVILQRDERLQVQYLKEVYAWLNKKLCKMGMLSKREQDGEEALLNPLSRSLTTSMNKLVKTKVLSCLVNDQDNAEHHKAMFVEEVVNDGDYIIPAERSTHTAIPPAHVRIQKF